MDNNSFTSFCSEINNLCISLQTKDKEIITDQNAFEAYAYLKYMSIEDSGDVLLYCACLNLLNTYVKQPGCKVTYRFKNEIAQLVAILSNIEIDDVYVDLQKDGCNPLLVLDIGGIQFSFHNVPLSSAANRINKINCHRNLTWDTIRKQMCAQSLFTATRKNHIRYSNLTFRGKNLNERVAALSEKYQQGKLGFEFFKSKI